MSYRISGGQPLIFTSTDNPYYHPCHSELEPAAYLNLSEMAAKGLLPQSMRHSHPDLDDNLKPNTTPITVDSIPAIHEAIYRKILTNIHYNCRMRECFLQLGVLRPHEDTEVDFVPRMTDRQGLALLSELNRKAGEKMWHRVRMFNEAINVNVGAAAWLWGNDPELEAAKASTANRCSGSVLFVYLPAWVLPEQEGGRFELLDMGGSVGVFVSSWTSFTLELNRLSISCRDIRPHPLGSAGSTKCAKMLAPITLPSTLAKTS